MGVSAQNKQYDNTFTFFGRKVVRHGDHYSINIPKDLATYILATYGGYVDIDIKVPTMYPKLPKDKKKA